MKKQHKTIGILGGMGPAASARLYQLIINIAQRKYNAVQDVDFPPIIINSLTLQDFDERGFSDGTTILPQLIQGINILNTIGSDIVAIACNTVHYFLPQIQEHSIATIINPITETAGRVHSAHHSCVGIVSSSTTNRLGLYSTALKSHDIKPLTLLSNQQTIIDDIIMNIMAGRNGKKDAKQLIKIIDSLYKQGATAVILGCTELPLALDNVTHTVPIFDSLLILAEIALQKAYDQNN